MQWKKKQKELHIPCTAFNIFENCLFFYGIHIHRIWKVSQRVFSSPLLDIQTFTPARPHDTSAGLSFSAAFHLCIHGNIDKMMKTSQELQKLHFTSYPLPVLVGNNWWCLNITSYYLPEQVMKLTGKSSSNVRSVSPLWLVCPVCPHDYPDYHDSNDDYDEHGNHHSTDESSLSP